MSIIKQHLRKLLEQKETPLWGGYVNMLKNMEAAFMSPEHWILEFLQNAEDAESKRFSIRIGSDFIWILNDGKEFIDENFYAICDVNSRKRPSAGFFGYLGIGFKSIFRISNRIDIHSGNFHFRFDEGYRDDSKRGKTPLHEWPWEILPIEIESVELPEGYTTGFYVPLRNTKGHGLLKEVTDYLTGEDFPKEAVLQLRNIKAIEIQTPQMSFNIAKEVIQSEKILVGGKKVIKEVVYIKKEIASRGNHEEDKYLLFRQTATVPDDIKQDDNTKRVRRSDVPWREIGLVFGLDDEGALKALEGKFAFVCSFMPVRGEQTGLPFGISGDFIPHYGRQIINYEAVWNQWICKEIVLLFKGIIDIFLLDEKWKYYPIEILAAIQSDSRHELWGKKLRDPIKELLKSTPIFDGRKVDEVVVIEPEDEDIVEEIEEATGKKVLPPIKEVKEISEIEKIPGIYSILQTREIIERLKKQPQKLVKRYHQIENLTPYFIGGRRGNDERLCLVPFVLADDNELYPPSRMMVLETDLSMIPRFLTPVVPEERKLLHPAIAKDEKAVKQLERCGLTIINEQTLCKDVRHLLEMVKGRDDCPESWKFPEDVIEATLFLISKGNAPKSWLIAKDGTLHVPKNLFCPNGPLDWLPLWNANFLPSLQPVHEHYFDKKLLEKYGLTTEDIWKYLREIGVSGFSAKDDANLLRLAGEAIAKERLREKGHDIEIVSGRTELGYDLQCNGHCNKVFEVKGMGEPNDVDLRPREWEIAQDKKEDAVLVCVYNIPNTPEKIGYREIPNYQRICKPVENAKVPRDEWMKA